MLFGKRGKWRALSWRLEIGPPPPGLLPSSAAVCQEEQVSAFIFTSSVRGTMFL